jgi:hypothetical protein
MYTQSKRKKFKSKFFSENINIINCKPDFKSSGVGQNLVSTLKLGLHVKKWWQPHTTNRKYIYLPPPPHPPNSVAAWPKAVLPLQQGPLRPNSSFHYS